ncbi:aromatic amino acid aminotransferase [Bacillus cereus]|uniref:aminotransferase A n=1 Tax=Bacillus sp. AFS023182 TaxID=2033492 RepID=UPI000BF45226|nr:aminotransferase A [Bacillus sp. AFS023182]PFE05801.1 aromatic amino acid aminotransferase [Bacillus sp. AFS023182]PGY04332.1 aromatic amino acid aminotransferase [Bacillus cereus]
MEQFINPRVKDIQISGIRQFSNMIQNYDNLISLTIGQPDFPTPSLVKEAAKRAITENHTNYTHNAGLLDLRKAACHFLNDNYDLHYSPENETIVTIGASEAIDVTFRTILEPGTEVILPAPIYPGYEPIIRLCGATPVFVDVRETGFRLTAEAIQKAITDQTRCIVLPYPSNPTGVTLSKEELTDIVSVLKNKNIFVLSDEIYSELVYEDNHISIAHFPEMRDKTIVINGLAKSHSMTGWRIGLLFAPSYLTQHILKVHQYNVTCATSISQYAAIEALTAAKDAPRMMRHQYKKRRDYVYNRLIQMGLTVEKPTGAFYLFPYVGNLTSSSFDFAIDLVKEAGLAVVPGTAFSEYGEGYLRLSYAYSMETLKEGCDRLERFLKQKAKR